MEIQLSVVIITFNEERNIERCLKSVLPVADDIVVVDSFSTDATQKICETFGVRFIQHAFAGHIQQKNWAITQAKYPYVLSLDADEALDENLIQSVLQCKKNWNHDGFSMNRLTNYCGQWIYHCSWYPDKKLRLWDSRKGAWTGTNPHDRYELNSDASHSHISGNLLHYSYYTLKDHLNQVNSFTDIAAKALFAKGSRSNVLKLFVSPPWKFFRMYILKLGFLDGFAGYTICRISAQAVFIKYAKLKQLYKQNEKN